MCLIMKKIIKNFVVVKDKLGDEQVKIFETAGGEKQGFVPTLELCSALNRFARMEVQLTPLTNAAADFLSL